MSIRFTLDLHYVDRHKIGKSNCQSVGLCILSESGATVRNIDAMKKERKEQAYLQNMSILDENEDKQFEDNFVSENMIRRYKGENRIILELYTVSLPIGKLPALAGQYFGISFRYYCACHFLPILWFSLDST